MQEFIQDVKTSFKKAWRDVPRLYFLPFTALYSAYKEELSKH